MRTLLVDVDDVLLHWTDGFREFLKKKGVKLSQARPTRWDLRHWVGNGATAFVDEFNHSSHFGYLEPDHEAVVALEDLYNKGFQIYAITSCTDDPSAVYRRRENLDEHFIGVFEDVICLPLGGCKLQTLKQFPRGSYWVEDKFENALAGIQAGHRAILLDKSHNQDNHHDAVTRCENWKAVHDLIIRETVNAIDAVIDRKRKYAPQK